MVAVLPPALLCHATGLRWGAAGAWAAATRSSGTSIFGLELQRRRWDELIYVHIYPLWRSLLPPVLVLQAFRATATAAAQVEAGAAAAVVKRRETAAPAKRAAGCWCTRLASA